MIYSAMAVLKFMLTEFPWNERYRVSGAEDVLDSRACALPGRCRVQYCQHLTPALAETPLAGGRILKNGKNRLHPANAVERGVRNFKCATTLELEDGVRKRR